MDRRQLLKAAAVLPVLAAGLYGGRAIVRDRELEDWQRQDNQIRAELLAAFPYERVEVSGRTALREWESLKRDGRGAPVVIGANEELNRVMAPFHPSNPSVPNESVVVDTLSRADRLIHPDDLLKRLQSQKDEADQWCKENPESCSELYVVNVDSTMTGAVEGPTQPPPDPEPMVGEWPDRVPPTEGLTVIQDWQTGRPFDTVNIVVIPTDDWTTIPAYLNWGGWNGSPFPEHHVAALRSWRDRYGAELIGLGPDVMNIRVTARPTSRDEAMALAREQYAYCYDIVEQGVGTLSVLAAMLKAHNWWFFWWD